FGSAAFNRRFRVLSEAAMRRHENRMQLALEQVMQALRSAEPIVDGSFGRDGSFRCSLRGDLGHVFAHLGGEPLYVSAPFYFSQAVELFDPRVRLVACQLPARGVRG